MLSLVLFYQNVFFIHFFFYLSHYNLEVFSNTPKSIELKQNQNFKVKTRVLSFKNRILYASFMFHI